MIVGGGVAYTIGFPVLMLRRPDPWPPCLRVPRGLAQLHRRRRSPPLRRDRHHRQLSALATFDVHVVVDWSAAGTARMGRDSIWCASGGADQAPNPINLSTRSETATFLDDLITAAATPADPDRLRLPVRISGRNRERARARGCAVARDVGPAHRSDHRRSPQRQQPLRGRGRDERAYRCTGRAVLGLPSDTAAAPAPQHEVLVQRTARRVPGVRAPAPGRSLAPVLRVAAVVSGRCRRSGAGGNPGTGSIAASASAPSRGLAVHHWARPGSRGRSC